MENDLTIQLFFFTLTIFAAAGAVKTRGWRAWLFGSLAAVVGVGGAAWTRLKEGYPSLSRAIAEDYPSLSRAISDVALNLQAWFTLFLLVLAVVALTGRKGRSTGYREDGPDLPEWVPSLPDRLSSTEESLEVFTRTITSQNKSLDSLDEQGKELRLRLEAIESILLPDRKDGKDGKDGKSSVAAPGTEHDNRFAKIEKKIEGAREYAEGLSVGVAQSVSQLRETIERNSRQIQDLYKILLLHEHDVVVRELGEKLLKADPASYANDAAWDDDYARWKSALDQIANIVREWAPDWVPHRARFLDLKASDYETNTAALPSTSKLTSDRSLVRYNTVAQGQHNYESQRDAMFQSVLQKAGEPPA